MTPAQESIRDGGTPGLFSQPGLLKSMVEAAVKNLLEEEVARHLGAGPYERSDGRRGYRNGSRPRTMKTAVGELCFQVPQVREGGFRTQLFERWQRSDKALVAAMQEMVVAGVSTRAVSDVLEAMGGFQVSAQTVSRTMAELDEAIASFFSRDLSGREFPYLVVDARYEKVRRSGRVSSMAVLVVAGIDERGRREMLAMRTGDSESEETWGDVLRDLKRRGLKGVQMVVSDAHAGIRAALARHMQGTSWQRCRVHLMREMLAKVGWKDMKELARDLRSIYASEQREQCVRTAAEVAAKWEKRAPRMARALLAGVEDTLAVWHLPARLRRRLNSTNMLERAMKEIKKRTRQVGSFPSESSCARLAGAVLLEIQDAWDAQPQRYLLLDERD